MTLASVRVAIPTSGMRCVLAVLLLLTAPALAETPAARKQAQIGQCWTR